jgi:hypothetical protein
VKSIYNPNHPVILFIPEAGIYPYLRGLAVLGDAITKRGGSVFITHDTGQMLRSPLMAMYRTSINVSTKERIKINRITDKNIKDVLEKYKFSSIELSEFVDNKLIKEINSLVVNPKSDLQKIDFRGFPVGQMAEFDFNLEPKYPYYSKLSSTHRELYKQYIKNNALAIAITDKICERYNPSLLLTFNEYGQCQAVRYGAKNHNVKHVSLTYPAHFNIDMSKFVIWESTYKRWTLDHTRKWNSWKDVPIREKFVTASWEDIIFRMYHSGSHIFSLRKKDNPSCIFKNLNLDPKKKTIIVYTSSQDERRCAGITMKIWGEKDDSVDVFSNQIEWLSKLRAYAAKRKDVQFVVRIHPREGFRQLGFNSQHLLKLKAKFKKNSQRFTIIWPDDPISSYDLMEFADVCLIAWSTIGHEAARVGIPVLSYVGNLYNPNDSYIQVASSRKDYKKKLDAIIQMDYKWQNLVKAIRFYHWRTFIPSLDLGKTIPADFDDRTLWPKADSSMVGVIDDILSGKQDLIKYNIKKWKDTLPANVISQEKKAIKLNIRWFLDKIFYPPLNSFLLFRFWRYFRRKITGNNVWVPKSKRGYKDYSLKFVENTSKLDSLIRETRRNLKLRIIVANGSLVTLINKGKLLHRISPMVIRLARLHKNN